MRKQQLQLKNQKRSPKKKKLVLITALVVIILAGGGVMVWKQHRSTAGANGNTAAKASDNTKVRPQNSVDYTSPATTEDNKASEQAKSDPKSNGTLDDTPSEPTNGNFTVTITGANGDNANRVVRVSSLVDGVTSGTCTVSFSMAGQTTVTSTNNVTLQTNSYVCPNFAIPYDQFPASGNWTVALKVVSNNKQVTATWPAGPVTIKK